MDLLEYFGVITGLLCVWLAAKNNIWNWPIAILSVTVYIFIFLENRLYADMGLQFYFLAMNGYGWYFWSRKRTTAEHERPVSTIKKRDAFIGVAAILISTLALGFFLFSSTDAAFPFTDSFCTACSLVAQIFLARKVKENWLLWIFVDIIYVGVYITKGLYPTALMYAIYIYIAWMGYSEWRKAQLEENYAAEKVD